MRPILSRRFPASRLIRCIHWPGKRGGGSSGHAVQAEAFRKALAIDPTSRDALNNLAWLLFQNRRLDEAESLARKAIAQAGPDSYLILDTLARVLVAKGACDEAMRTFRQAIDAVPSSRAEARADIESGLAAARRTCS